MIILGIILLIAGFLLKISILWTIGIILVVIGVILTLLGIGGTRGRRQAHLLLTGRSQPVMYEACGGGHVRQRRRSANPAEDEKPCQ